MATIPSTPEPSYPATKASNPNVRVTQFGDGYQQRTTFGLNQNAKTWTFNWNNITEAESDVFEAFLDARGGVESFDYTPPNESTSYKYICKSWNKTLNLPNRANLTATFIEVFEP